MQVFGIAAAFLHDKEDSAKLHIHCNPVSMSGGQRNQNQILKDLAYSETVDLTDIEGSCRALKRFVDTWEEVAKRQRDGFEQCGRHDLAERLPVALLAGDADFNRLDLNAIYMTFFGRKLFTQETRREGMHEFMRLLQIIQERYPDMDDPETAKKMGKDADALRAYALMDKISSNNDAKLLLARVTEARKSYLENQESYPQDFFDAMAKLPGLLKKSFYHHGRFSNSGAPVYGSPPDFTEEIKSLEQPFKAGAARARDRLLEIAAALGDYYGREFTGGSKVFKLWSPKKFSEETELQAKHPELAFFHWTDASGDLIFRNAFHEAFHNANWHPSYRSIRLPMEGDNPYYVDPVLDMMMELSQIAQGTRAWFSIEQSHDDPDYTRDHAHKARLAELAEQTCRSVCQKPTARVENLNLLEAARSRALH